MDLNDCVCAGVTLADIRAVRPQITIGSLNEEINKYLYFLFCPTIVYRDTYPRLPGPINYIRAAMNLCNLIGAVIYTYVVTAGKCD
jgi:hypothetical protein